jgi:hypothetical protein
MLSMKQNNNKVGKADDPNSSIEIAKNMNLELCPSLIYIHVYILHFVNNGKNFFVYML